MAPFLSALNTAGSAALKGVSAVGQGALDFGKGYVTGQYGLDSKSPGILGKISQVAGNSSPLSPFKVGAAVGRGGVGATFQRKSALTPDQYNEAAENLNKLIGGK